MSTRIAGPLAPLRPRHSHWVGIYDAPPQQRCPDCRRPLRIVAASFFAGIQCGVEFVLQCSDGHRYKWDSGTSFEDEAYGDQR